MSATKLRPSARGRLLEHIRCVNGWVPGERLPQHEAKTRRLLRAHERDLAERAARAVLPAAGDMAGAAYQAGMKRDSINYESGGYNAAVSNAVYAAILGRAPRKGGGEMKVLLFVQTGDARPKVAKQFGVRAGWAEQYFARIRFGEPGQPERGWLVECANAEAGRVVIETHVQARKYGPDATVHFEFWDGVSKRHGRILAQGGRP